VCGVMKILVLGHRGMLGSTAARVLGAHGHDVVCTEHRFAVSDESHFLDEIGRFDGDMILNCIAAIDQTTSDKGRLYQLNSLLPLLIADRMRDDAILVQPSTDGVFSGKSDRAHRVTDLCDASDDYGCSKRLGELALAARDNVAVLRVSIIGPVAKNARPTGLMAWLLTQPGRASVNGFNNHFWNGITTVEWAFFVDRHLASRAADPFLGKITQLGTEAVHSKYDVLCQLRDRFRPDICVNSVASPTRINRALIADFPNKTLSKQLDDLVPYMH
jgi:dTDP-4-dehydrorhamnose reductase